MISEHIVKELEAIVNKGLEESLIPYQKGNSIRIKNMVVRYNERKGYLIYDTKTNTQVARTQFKSCALAIAKSLASGKGNQIVKTVLDLEYDLSKHYNDAIFYKNAMRKVKDPEFREVREIRLDIALQKSRAIRDKIDKFIFSN